MNFLAATKQITNPRERSGMKFKVLAIVAVITVLAGGAAAQSKPQAKVKAEPQAKVPLKLLRSIPLPALKAGDFDHFAIDLEGHRLFLTAEENGKLLVFDTNSNKLIHTIEDLKAPHAVLYRKEFNKLFVVDGDESAVKIYDAQGYQLLGKVGLDTDADSMAYDPTEKYMYVVNGGREAKTPYSFITVVDASASRKVRDIKIDSDRIEAVVLEKSGRRLFCNITGTNTVGVMDRTSSSLQKEWNLPAGVQQNVALALDEKNHRLFVVARKPGRLVVLDSDNGKVLANLPAVGMVDDMAYDADHQRLYLAGDQFVDVFSQKDSDHYALLARIPGGFRAKTGILVPELSRYYLAIPRHGSISAKVNVYEVQP
jgi:DNA-binding beta-propeller fold protein YncE